jgi:hypothetical protein
MVGSDDATLALVERILAFLRYCAHPDCSRCAWRHTHTTLNPFGDVDRAGEVVYIHCYGGHGRTGIFASVLLGRIYGIDAEKALQLCKLYHDCRYTSSSHATVHADHELCSQYGTLYRPDVEGISAKSVPSPQTHDQRAQVVRLLR